MNVPGVTTSAFIDGLSGFFDRTCTIRQDTGTTKSAAGKPIANWTALSGHSDIACRFAPASAIGRSGRNPLPEMTVTTYTHVVMLAGPYPAVRVGMQAVMDDGVTYVVDNIIRDSEQVACELLVERVTT